MRVIRGFPRELSQTSGRVVTLGNFDGVHVGHQAICRQAVARARERGIEAAAVTFHPHPVAVLAPDRAPKLIVRLRDRLALLGETGLDTIIAQRFSRQFATCEAEEFVRDYLLARLGASHVVVGHSVRFGHNRAGDGALLERLGRTLGFRTEIVGPVSVDEHVVSSSEVRRTIAAGDCEHAALLLGRPHFVCGTVVYGKRRGAGLGFPTANVRVSGVILPPDGVYAVRADLDGGVRLGGVANLGVNPTFGPGERSLEAHLFNFDADIYGRRLKLEFVTRLRGEVRFPNPQALVEQIGRDVAAARAVLAE